MYSQYYSKVRIMMYEYKVLNAKRIFFFFFANPGPVYKAKCRSLRVRPDPFLQHCVTVSHPPPYLAIWLCSTVPRIVCSSWGYNRSIAADANGERAALNLCGGLVRLVNSPCMLLYWKLSPPHPPPLACGVMIRYIAD